MKTLKLFLLIIIYILELQVVFAQEIPQKQSSTTNQQISISIQQKNAKILFNEFENKRNTFITPNSRQIPQKEQIALDSLVEQLQQNAPQTFEYHYATYINSSRSNDNFFHLEKALELSNNKTELYDDLIAHFEINNMQLHKLEYIQKWYKSGSISKAIYDYNYNVLQSVEQNAILFTNGTMDTHPLWILQEMENVRKDVLILNFELLQNKNYLNKIYINLFGFKDENKKQYIPEIKINLFLQKVLKESNRPVYFGLTIPPKIADSLKQNLYVTGLAFKYSTQSFNNLEVLKQNWEQNFRPLEKNINLNFDKYEPAFLEHSNSAFTRMPVQPDKKRDLNSNYIVPALMLYKFYYQKNDIENTRKFENIARNVAATESEIKLLEDFINKVKSGK